MSKSEDKILYIFLFIKMNCGLMSNEESICEQAMIMAGKCIMRKFKLNDKEYTVNALGELYDSDGKELSITVCGKNKNNYRCTRLNCNKATAYVPRVVYYVFHYNTLPPELQHDKDVKKSLPSLRITHVDGDNSNNRIWNLKTVESNSDSSTE